MAQKTLAGIARTLFRCYSKTKRNGEKNSSRLQFTGHRRHPSGKGTADYVGEVIPQILTKRIEERQTGFLRPQEIELVHQWIIRRGKRVDVWRDREGKFVSAREEAFQGKKE